jgi:hypothetical protein
MTAFGVSKRVLRAGITALIVLDLLAIAGFAVRRTTVTVRTTRPTASSAPASVSAAPPPTTAPAITAPTAPAVAIAAGGSKSASTSPSGGKGGPSTTTPVVPPKSGIPPVAIAAIGKCPVKLAAPAELGGLQSLVAFAPAFGPFSAEAFAAASAYQPELELLGPILAQYPKAAPVLDPLLAPVLKLFGSGTSAFFSVISPVYTPERTQVLSAETKLAAALAPYSAKLAGTPVAGCVVDLEAALVGDTKSSRTKSGGQG